MSPALKHSHDVPKTQSFAGNSQSIPCLRRVWNECLVPCTRRSQSGGRRQVGRLVLEGTALARPNRRQGSKARKVSSAGYRPDHPWQKNYISGDHDSWSGYLQAG